MLTLLRFARRERICALLLAAGFTIAPGARAAVLAEWTTTGSIDSAVPYPATAAAFDIDAGPLVTAPQLSAVVATDQFAASGWPITPSGLDPDRYIEFTVAPTTGVEIQFDLVEFFLVGTGVPNQTTDWELRSDVDCFTSGISGSETFTGAVRVSIDVSATAPQTGAVTFRLYLFDNTLPTQRGVNDLVVDGTTSNTGPVPFTQVSATGFCESTLPVAIGGVFLGDLYGGVGNTTTGAQLWRTDDRITWEQVVDDGFGNADNTSAGGFVEFSGMVYSGTANTVGGGEIHRSSDGASWSSVATGGFGDAANVFTAPTAVFGSHVYASTQSSAGGAAVWRSPDGSSWAKASADGFGDANNALVAAAEEFGGQLYASTLNFSTGVEVWRTPDGTTWTQVNTDAFGDPNNLGAGAVAAFGGDLYVSTNNFSGAQIWRSPDGTTWTQVLSGGLGGDPSNTSISLDQVGGQLFASTVNSVTGGQLYRSSDGLGWTQVVGDGLGNPANSGLTLGPPFQGHLTLATSNLTTGGAIYSAPFTAVTVPAAAPLALAATVLALGYAALVERRRRERPRFGRPPSSVDALRSVDPPDTPG